MNNYAIQTPEVYKAYVTESNPVRSKLIIVPSPGFCIFFPKAKPNWWVRFWQGLLLGWVWEDVEP